MKLIFNATGNFGTKLSVEYSSITNEYFITLEDKFNKTLEEAYSSEDILKMVNTVIQVNNESDYEKTNVDLISAITNDELL